MNKIWITQVFGIKSLLRILSDLFWINEKPFNDLPEKRVFLKNNWIIALYQYKNRTIKNAIWQMKYRSNRQVAKFFGQEMARFLIENKNENYILVPIPIHWRRRLERGFNQSEWLCQETVKAYPKIKFEKVLKRTIYTKKQSWNNKVGRQKNIVSVFKVRDKFKDKTIGQNFLLIDDVVTTGATLTEARHQLLIHGATSVKALAVAH